MNAVTDNYIYASIFYVLIVTHKRKLLCVYTDVGFLF